MAQETANLGRVRQSSAEARDVMTVAEVAAALRMSVRTFAQKRADGLLALKPAPWSAPNRPVFRRRDVERALGMSHNVRPSR